MTQASSPARPDTLVLPLRSDPPWLLAGIAGLSAVSLAAFVLLFRGHLPAALGLLPGLTVAVFGGAALAAWGRRRGATVFLDVTARGVEARAGEVRQEVIDLGSPWSAVLLVDRKPGRRMLVLGQRGEATVVLESGRRAAPGGNVWGPRTLALDLDVLALSPASAQVLALGSEASLDPILERLGGELDPEAPWLLQATTSGGIMVRPGQVRVGRRSVVLGPSKVLASRVVEVNGLTIAATELSEGEVTPHREASHADGAQPQDESSLLLACEDAVVPKGALPTDRTPDAYVSLLVYEVVRAAAG